jgi:recombination associated protein RdgC
MWFKNLVLYRLANWSHDAAALERALSRLAFRNCSAMEMETRGWVSPRGEAEGALVHPLGPHLLIALGSEQKLLPASVINQYAQDRVQEVEAQQGFKPGRKQLRDIKLSITDELMPRAFSRRRTTYAWIDAERGWLAVDAAALGKADEVLECLLACVDGLAVTFLETAVSPAGAMSGWLARHEPPPAFTIDRECELLLPDAERATVRYVRHTLETAEIRNHIANGKQVSRLAMTWNARLSFVLCENLQVKRLDFVDLIKEQSQQEADNTAEQFDADFALMTGECSRFLGELMEALGGVAGDAARRAPERLAAD